MNNVKVKVCGIQDLESALGAIDAGADYLGFNFVRSSRRYVEPVRVRGMVDVILERGKGVGLVGVFQDEGVDRVNEIVRFAGLDYVQLHGDEDVFYVKKMTAKVIKRVDEDFRVGEDGVEGVRYLLIDRARQGVGRMVDFERAKGIAENFLSFVAGGLTPENVAEVVRQVEPYGVDVAGGVETEGRKDVVKIREFVRSVKRKTKNVK